MIAEAIMYHLAIIKLLLVVLLFNLATPWFAKTPHSKWIRTGFFLFSGLIGMIIFSGIVIFIFTSGVWTMRTIVMSIVAFVLIITEVKRVRAIAQGWRGNNDIKLTSTKYISFELILLIATTIWLIISK